MKRIFGLVLVLALVLPAGAPSAQQVVIQKPRPWLGLYLVEPAPGHVEVQEVLAGSPAERAGLKAGDRILTLAGAPLAGMDAFIQAVQAEAPGRTLSLTVLRGQETVAVEATLGRDPAQAPRILAPGAVVPQARPAEGRKPWLGLSITEREDGLVQIQEVAPGSPAEKAGLRAQDCILALSGKPMPSADALIQEVRSLAPGTRATLRILRGEERLNLEVVLGVDPAQTAGSPPVVIQRPGEAQPAQPERPRVVDRPLQSPGRPGLQTLSPANLERALDRARELQRPLLLLFMAGWSSPSRHLQDEMKKPELARVLQGFLVLPVDVDLHPGLADRFRVDTLPHLEVLAPTGTPAGKILGLPEVSELARRLEALRGRALSAQDPAGRAAPRPRREGEARPAEERLDRELLEELRRIRKLLEEIREALRG